MKKKLILILTIVILALSLCACSRPEQEYTGGDTDIGGLFRDILHGIRGDGPGNTEFENNSATNPALPEECEKGRGIK